MYAKSKFSSNTERGNRLRGLSTAAMVPCDGLWDTLFRGLKYKQETSFGALVEPQMSFAFAEEITEQLASYIHSVTTCAYSLDRLT